MKRVWPGVHIVPPAEERDRDAERVRLVDAGGTDVVTVSLALGDRTVVGRTASSEAGGHCQAAATATLRALDELTPGAVRLVLHWCGVAQPVPELPPIVTVLVGLDVAGVPMRYPGAVVIHDDDVPRAAAAAVLNALNRRLEIMRS